MKYEHRPMGVCANRIYVDVENGTVKDVEFFGGCDGNHKGLVALIKDMKAEEAIARLSGIRCGFRNTSCPDQLAKALEAAMALEK